MSPIDEARGLVAANGRKAQQMLVDEIVAAIRRGDDEEAARRGAVLRALDHVAIAAVARR